ncbi:MAG: O-antigen ligase family protein [Phycisphaerae bacterium]|nr:O-antigen ligase family protein [Phycisphaerae bacterium]
MQSNSSNESNDSIAPALQSDSAAAAAAEDTSRVHSLDSPRLTSAGSGARKTSLLLLWIAGPVMIASCLLTSPWTFSEAHRADKGSWLKTVVSALALVGPSAEAGRYPTARIVDIRSLTFYMGAAMLTLVGGLRLLTSGARPSLSRDDFWDWRARTGSPMFWWSVLICVSLVTSSFSHARDVSLGQSAIRLMQAAWWWPIAALLLPIHARRLTTLLLTAVGLTVIVGLWYHTVRVEPDWFSRLLAFTLPTARMEYPIGNSLWFGACLLPGIFAALGLGADSFMGGRPDRASRNRTIGAIAILFIPPLLVALLLTQSRSSAWAGLGGGILFAIFMLTRRTARSAVLLLGLVLAIAAVWGIQEKRVAGEMGERAHSIRTRLNHEWPYAITLFLQKPVGGHGEGCYTMLAPQFAREDQIDEPSTLAMGDRWWFSHAHNEFLELLADLGLIGATAFLLALVMTLRYAIRYCDLSAADPTQRPYRLLTVGLAAGLFAMMVEECSSVALRNPGFPPLFLTTWAILWALIRDERMASVPALPGDLRLGAGVFRGGGLIAAVASMALCYFAVQDWRANLASQEAQQDLRAGLPVDAIAKADFAAAHLLDPLQRLSAMMFGISARTDAFAAVVAKGGVPTDQDIALAMDAWVRQAQLGRIAPRFLNLSRYAADLARHLAQAHRVRGELNLVDDRIRAYREALIRWVNDEPFNTQLVRHVWSQVPEASAYDRLLWLRRLMRRGEMDEASQLLARELFERAPVAITALDDLLQIGMQDLGSPPARWSDRLTPETFRLAAMVRDWMGAATEAEQLAKKAEEAYAALGPSVFAAHSAVIREAVIYALHGDPTGRTDELLGNLVRAHVIMDGPMKETGEAALHVPLPREKGVTRALVLTAAGREAEAMAQLEFLRGATGADGPTLADAYVSLSSQFAPKPQFADQAIRWAERARDLNPGIPLAHYALFGLYLNRGDEAAAFAAAKKFVEVMPDRDQAFTALMNQERRRPESGIWTKLRAAFPDYPEMPVEMETTSQPATDPATLPEDPTPITSQPQSDEQSD